MQRNAMTFSDERWPRTPRDERLLASLDRLSLAAASTPVTGPGLSVTVTDPGVGPNLSDVSKQRVGGSQQIILDRDLQLVVNSLWASGAEAISVGGVRIGPNVTIRQAGGAILVDNNPTSSPYAVLAVGPPHAMQDVFDNSPGLTPAAAPGGIVWCRRRRQRQGQHHAPRRGSARCQVRQTDWFVVRNHQVRKVRVVGAEHR